MSQNEDTNDLRRERVREKMADPTVYEMRRRYRGAGKPYYRWVPINGKWREVEIRTHIDRATEAVHEGTIKALTTEALPETPTLSWFHQIDKNAQRDQDRRENRERAARGALTAGEIIDERARLPAKPTFQGQFDENDDSEDAPPPHRDVEPGPMPRYLPPVSGPHVRDERPDNRLTVQQEQAAARRALEDLRLRAGVDETTFDLLRRYWVARESTRNLAAEAGVSHQAIGNRITKAMNKIQDAARTGIDRVQEAFRKGFGAAE